MNYEAIVVGGSYAGLSAALQLARARRRVLVIDGGERRNRFAATSHGFLGQDGRAPGEIVAEARDQLLRYPNVAWRSGLALSARQAGEGFAIETGDGAVQGDRVVLAVGVTDALPDVPGLTERWGRSVFHCPYCHGYELDQGRIGVLAGSELSMHHALMLPDWGPTTFFLNGAFEPDSAQLSELERRGVVVERTPVARVTGERADMVLADGRVVPLDGLFTLSRTRPSGTLAEQLGCRLEESPMGRFIAVDGIFRTSVPGVMACGDAARAAGSVALAVGDGAMAGVSTHRSLIFGPD